MRHGAARAVVLLGLSAVFPLTASAQTWWLDVGEEGRARFASGSDPNGQDIDVRLTADGGLSDRSDRFTARFALGLWFDVDGAESGELTPAVSLHDQSVVDPDVYSLYGDYRPGGEFGSRGFLKGVRVGRQTAGYGLPTTFDGASFVVSPLRPQVDLFAFGGRTVHFFEAADGLFEDWIGAAGVAVRPVEGLKLVADYRFASEDVDTRRPGTARVGGDGEEEEEEEEEGEDAGEIAYGRASVQDHSYGLSAWFNPADWAWLRAYARGLGQQASHAGGAGMLFFPSVGLGFEASFDSQLVRLGEVSDSLNPFYAILGESLPHARWRADLFEELNTGAGAFGIHLGVAGRAVLEGEEGPFNRSSSRAYLLLSATDIAVPGPYVSVVGDAWLAGLNPDIKGEGFLTVGGAAGYKGNALLAEVGTAYQRFKYAYYKNAEEISDVRSWYAEVGYDVVDWLRVKARYELEQFDWDVHTVTLSLGQSF